MILSRGSKSSGQTFVFVAIVLAIIGGAYWWMSDARETAEKDARAFAQEVGTRLAVKFDAKFLNAHLSREADMFYTTSFRDRLFERLRQQGTPDAKMDVKGHVDFESYAFKPKGKFRVELDYASAPAYLDLVISYRNAEWQIDGMNFTWTAAPD